MAGKIILVGVGRMTSVALRADCSAIAVWLFEGAQVDLKSETFLFMYEHPIGERRIESGAQRRAIAEGDPKVLEIGEALLPITAIQMVYVRPDGIVAICGDGAGASAAVWDVVAATQKLFAIGTEDDISIDENNPAVLAHFFKMTG